MLGGGHRRTRGCFWLPTRPTQVCQWEGAGGMLSIGAFDDWYDMRPHTRIVVVGTDEGREELETTLRSCLLTDDEIERHGLRWRVPGDARPLGPVDGVSRWRDMAVRAQDVAQQHPKPSRPVEGRRPTFADPHPGVGTVPCRSSAPISAASSTG